MDNSAVKTLEHPEVHSIHCLVDVGSCVRSGYRILVKDEGADLYREDVQLDNNGNDMAVVAARTIGKCSTCYGAGEQREGFGATVIGTLDKSMDPPLLTVRELLPMDTPCPAKTPPAAFCFAADTMEVLVEGQGSTRMKDLKLGDRVETLSGRFEPIYSFGHKYTPGVQAEFVQLTTANKKTLELTKNHMVIMDDKSSVPSSAIEKGDVLHGGDIVSSVKMVRRFGIVSPFTESGTIVVNGIAASTFVAFGKSESMSMGKMEIPVSFQWLARAFESPHRMYCKHVGDCSTERYSSDGISKWVSGPLVLAEWVVLQHPVITTVCLIPTFFVLALMLGLEMLLNSMMLPVVVVGALLIALLPSRKDKQL